MKKFHLAVLASHPIQYHVPLYRLLAAHSQIDLRVYYCSAVGLAENHDPGFGIALKWDIPLLEDYAYEFLRNYSLRPSPNMFFGLINPGIFAVLRKEKHGVILVHGYDHATNWLAFLAAFVTRTPILFRGETILRASASRLKARAKDIFLRALFRQTAACLAIGMKSREFYRHYGVPDARIFLTPYAVDNEFFFMHRDTWHGRKDELKRELGIASDMPVILSASKLIPRKRPLDLLRAFESLQTRAALVFVGDGALRGELEAHAREKRIANVFFAGFKNQTELPRYYALADIFVLPSSYEPWGLVVNEAMCFGLPIITTDAVAAAYDLVREGENGFVCRVGDVGALTERLRVLLDNANAREKMGTRSLEIISTWDYNADVRGIVAALENLR